ncbi:glycoside hydrolase family 5 protein [Mycena floridula]|nr:glycoside hydrolase family 5 protein [Mycena floridula]
MAKGNDLYPPRPTFVSEHSSSVQSSPSSSTSRLHLNKNETDSEYGSERKRPPLSKKGRSGKFWILCVLAVILVVVVVVVALYFAVIKPKNDKDRSSGSGSGSSDNSDPGWSSSTFTTGGDGSTVTLENGTTFTYNNKFGGYWVWDPAHPFTNDARPNSWTPPLNQSWTFGKDKINGVNLGGWFVLEPFITPAIFQKYPEASDEWSLSTLMAADTANGGLQQLEEHYATFITEQDIADIVAAGLNWVRVPIPYWAVEKYDNEPFLERTAWKYFLRLVGWCRKYGVRIKLDLHTVPGSQNGYNHSGKLGHPNFLYGVMGVANAQRTLSYLRVITEFIMQPEYVDMFPIFGIINEAALHVIGRDQLTSFYLEAHNMIRNITGVGAGNGPYISVHDGFDGEGPWAGFLTGSDRVILDTHPYIAFNGQANNAPLATGEGDEAGGIWPGQACRGWGGNMRNSQAAFGITIAGEMSNGYNDCGLYVRGVNNSAKYGDCTLFQDSTNWNSTMKAGLNRYILASMDALQDYFFWTWKIGNSNNNRVESPLWSYKLGLDNGWMPLDPREANGMCNKVGVPYTPFTGTYSSWQTGGAGAGTIAASATQTWGQFPFPTILGAGGGPASLLPTYTATGPIPTLPGPTFTATPTPTTTVDGWFKDSDNAPIFTPVAGCTYPNAWSAVNIAVPAPCTG